ncbi:MAG: trigger factor [Planctomycetota bacterium]|nr:trigger factor [Planctomycetota bacterium]
MTEETKNAPEQDPAVNDNVAADVISETAESEESKLPDNTVTVEDAGTLRKKVTVQVNRQRIDAKFSEMFGELGRTAQVPGFRIGRAPRRLIEKRFGKDVADDVRNSLVGEAIGDALDKAEFKTIGEPEIKLEEIELPEKDEMTFSFEVEVAPEFDLPDYKGIEIKRPVIEVNDERIDEFLTSFRHRYGRFKPTDTPAQAGDVVVADVSITGDNIDFEQSNLELRVAPAQVEGIILEDLEKTLTGNKTGDKPSVKATVPAGHPNEDWREKEVTATFDIREVKRLELPELNDDFAQQAGFDSIYEMRQAVSERLESGVIIEQRRAMRNQVCDFLSKNVSFDLPEGLARRYASRLLMRRAVELMDSGVPKDRIDQNLQELQAAAEERAEGELKLSFILGKLADAEDIEVDDGEINARIAQMAAQYNRRPERLRQEMTKEGTLDQLATAIREEKAIEKVLEQANIIDAEKEGDKKKDDKKKK